MSYKVSYKRHVAKTISYRVLSTTVGFFAMWWVTKSIEIGAFFGIVELVYKPLQYYFHERIWYKWIKFGLIKDLEKKKKVITPKIIEPLPTIDIPEPLETSPQIEVKETQKKILNYSSLR